MTSVHRIGPRAGSTGAARYRGRPGIRPLLVLTVCAAAALAGAGCSSGGTGGSGGSGGSAGGTGSASPGGSSPGNGTTSASQALSLAASQARQVSSFSAMIAVSTAGAQSSRASGRVDEQVRPTLLAREMFHTTALGKGAPATLEIVLTSKALYMKSGALAKTLGKPWLKVPFASLKHAAGFSIAPLLHQLQGNNPLADAEMLTVSRNVRQVGTATVNGVATTEYTGTLNLAQALAKLDPAMRKALGPGLSSSGVTTSHFTVWIDGQHLIRKIVETESAGGSRIATTVVITSINQPVHISVPPASQVARMPGF